MLALGRIWLAFADQAAAEMPRFKSYQIGDMGRSMGQTSLVDVDRDGDLDWVVGQSGNYNVHSITNRYNDFTVEGASAERTGDQDGYSTSRTGGT